ncbi:MAG TPA: hypothetical protein PLB75_05940 [Paludibacteraceae bacterium]|nr:hypothetical protein [Paludibacteraceae bacterium]
MAFTTNKNLKMTDTGTASANKRTAPYYTDYARIAKATAAINANVAPAVKTTSTAGKTGASAGANATQGTNFANTVTKNKIKDTMGYASSPEELWQTYNEYQNTYNNYDNGGGNPVSGFGGGSSSGGGATRASSGGSLGGGGGVSTASLIGNLVTDPTAEVRQRYAGILADLANNNQYVLDKLKGNYDTSVNTINADYDTSISRQNADAEDALRQAYINYMMSRKNMDSALARQGYTGGLSESNQARMFNNYGNIRNDIRKTLNNAIENYNLKRNAALGEALNQYNAQLADQASDYFNKKQNYETTLSNALANLMR